MAEIESAMAGHVAPGRHGQTQGRPGVTLEEVRGRDLVQVGAWPATLEEVATGLGRALGTPAPAPRGPAVASGSLTAFFVGPDKIWVTAPFADALPDKLGRLWSTSTAVVTELGHSRTVIRIAGANARDLLARFLALDTDPALFPPGRVASAGLHGIGVTLHHVADGVYDLYVPRTFALSVAEALVEVAEQWGVEVKG
jgi:sarcosine oxidase subunit gamma